VHLHGFSFPFEEDFGFRARALTCQFRSTASKGLFIKL